jgi:myo-inositol-1(or 4)-monophosphatase
MVQAIGGIAEAAHSVRVIGSAALALAWVACGRMDAYVNLGVGPWDAAAAVLLIYEAGGRLTTLAGAPWTLNDRPAVGSNGRLHAAVAAFFN